MTALIRDVDVKEIWRIDGIAAAPTRVLALTTAGQTVNLWRYSSAWSSNGADYL